MGEYLSVRARSVGPSRTIAMNQRARELKAAGRDVIDLTVGEPDFPTPEPIREAAERAIEEGYTRYTPVAGYPELREAVARKFLRENRLSFPAANVMVSSGAKQCLANVLLALVDPGDEVLIPAPYWVSYAELARLAGGRPVVIPTLAREGYKLDPERLEAAIGERSKALILCSPSNPTGSVYSAEELLRLAEVLERHPRIWVVSDEVYEHITYVGAHASPAAIPSIAERVAVVNGVSKAYAMTGWRIGYVAAARPLIEACSVIQGQMTTNACSVAQRAALAALDSDPAIVESMRARFEKRRGLALAAAERIPGLALVKPEGAFYLFPDLSAFFGREADGSRIEGSDALSAFLLEKAGVATVPGSAFGDEACIRLSFATDEATMAEAMRRIEGALASLRP